MIEMKTQRKRLSRRKTIKKGKQVQRKRLSQRGGGFFDDVWSGFKGVFVSQPAPVENQSTQMPTNTSIPRRNEPVAQPPAESSVQPQILAQPSMRRRRNNSANL